MVDRTLKSSYYYYYCCYAVSPETVRSLRSLCSALAVQVRRWLHHHPEGERQQPRHGPHQELHQQALPQVHAAGAAPQHAAVPAALRGPVAGTALRLHGGRQETAQRRGLFRVADNA